MHNRYLKHKQSASEFANHNSGEQVINQQPKYTLQKYLKEIDKKEQLLINESKIAI
jgi:hypothetical protein